MQRVERSIRVKAPVEKVYTFWRNFENLPRIMEHVESVRVTGPDKRLSHWKLKGPVGINVEFDAELTQDEPNRSLAWNSRGGSLGTTGNVTFTPTEDNTLVHVVMQWYDPPAGPIGEAVSKLLQNPDQMLEEDLQRFKEQVEKEHVTVGKVH